MWIEIVLNAWICDKCGIEVLSPGDGIPEGWTLSVDGERHSCAVCALALVGS